MMKFIYDSIDTVKSLKHPTKKDYINLTIAIFVLVVFAGLLFIGVDTLFGGGYNLLFDALT
ncbi:MAG: preprotein translocase subunit SecE [candidate division SR1 bacterium]|nr:MAG: preprotein translocase subunit SecE [candidate division SR1 bacterium]